MISPKQEILITMKGLFFITIDFAKSEGLMEANLKVNEICKRIASNGYCKSAKQIRAMILETPNIAPERKLEKWLESVWGKYISDNDIAEIFNVQR